MSLIQSVKVYVLLVPTEESSWAGNMFYCLGLLSSELNKTNGPVTPWAFLSPWVLFLTVPFCLQVRNPSTLKRSFTKLGSSRVPIA